VRKKNAHYTVMSPASEATFVLNRIGLEDEAVYSIRLGGTLRNMENKTSLVVTGKKFVNIMTYLSRYNASYAYI
jgi:hypothetical protein